MYTSSADNANVTNHQCLFQKRIIHWLIRYSKSVDSSLASLILSTRQDHGCILFQNLMNLDQSRFVRRDRSSLVKKNMQIFLVIVDVVIWFSSVLSAEEHTLFYQQQRWAWLSQIFSDVSEQIRFDWEHGAFRSHRSRFVRFWKRMQPIYDRTRQSGHHHHCITSLGHCVAPTWSCSTACLQR